jgi:hypothetical protein
VRRGGSLSVEGLASDETLKIIEVEQHEHPAIFGQLGDLW